MDWAFKLFSIRLPCTAVAYYHCTSRSSASSIAMNHPHSLSSKRPPDITSPPTHNTLPPSHPQPLTITLLVPRPRPGPTKLLRLTSPVIRNQEGAVVLDQRLLQLVLG